MNSVFSPLQRFLLTWLLVLLVGWGTAIALGYVGELISILLASALITFLPEILGLKPRPFRATLL